MSADAIIDTGAILAVLDRNDRWHTRCAAAIRQLPIPLLTTDAVLTELFHLTRSRRVDLRAAWKFLLSGVITVAAIQHRELPAIQTLMEEYADLPMDFANATLVYLARRERRSAILTIDRDFATYRIEGRKRFRVFPAS